LGVIDDQRILGRNVYLATEGIAASDGGPSCACEGMGRVYNAVLISDILLITGVYLFSHQVNMGDPDVDKSTFTRAYKEIFRSFTRRDADESGQMARRKGLLLRRRRSNAKRYR
jgi:hypothetical protein